jgi:hypothetical protein
MCLRVDVRQKSRLDTSHMIKILGLYSNSPSSERRTKYIRLVVSYFIPTDPLMGYTKTK